jgi:glucosamine-6-phosphate deaminase
MTCVSGNEARVDALAVRVLADGGELGREAAQDAATVIAGAVARAGEANVMLATGNSQLAFLEALTTREAVPWGRVRIFHMDEYVGLAPDHPASFARYIRTRVSDRVGPLEVNYFRQTANVSAASDEADRYAALLRRYPVDLCVMGIGENGHLAFNDPGVADFADPLDVKVVALDRACRQQQVGEGHFPTLADVPAHAITVTTPALLRAGDVVVVCPEARKASAVSQALLGPVSPTCPASILRRQRHARLYLDAESAKGLPSL